MVVVDRKRVVEVGIPCELGLMGVDLLVVLMKPYMDSLGERKGWKVLDLRAGDQMDTVAAVARPVKEQLMTDDNAEGRMLSKRAEVL